MHRNTKIVAIATLSLLCAVQAFYLKVVAPNRPDSESPAALFNQPRNPFHPGRTLRPGGQTEDADLVNELNFEKELADVLPELHMRPYTDDYVYISPTAQTAKLMLKRAFRKLENVYVSEAYDCDDNAQEMMVLLRKEALVEFREFPAGLAVGFVGARIDGPIWEFKDMSDDPKDYPMFHAMIVMRIKGGHWWLIEPLSHQVCEFTGPIFEGQLVIGMLWF